MNPFRTWVLKYGKEKLAKKLGVTLHAVDYWAKGRGSPRAGLIMRLVELSRGSLSAEEIIKYSNLPHVKGGPNK